MKKILMLLSLFILCSCANVGKQRVNLDTRYLSLIEMLRQNESFSTTSEYFDINVEMAKIDDGYRYYITIDNPRIAMYDIEGIAIEEGDNDYTNTMAATIGVFDKNEYAMVPNQKNTDKGYYSGVIMSGVTNNPETVLDIFITYKNSNYSNIHSEYFRLEAKYGED